MKKTILICNADLVAPDSWPLLVRLVMGLKEPHYIHILSCFLLIPTEESFMADANAITAAGHEFVSERCTLMSYAELLRGQESKK